MAKHSTIGERERRKWNRGAFYRNIRYPENAVFIIRLGSHNMSDRLSTSGSRFRFAVLPPLLIAKVMVWGFMLSGATDPARRVFCFPSTTSSSLLSLTLVGGFPSWCCHKSFILIMITVITVQCALCLLALSLFNDDQD